MCRKYRKCRKSAGPLTGTSTELHDLNVLPVLFSMFFYKKRKAIYKKHREKSAGSTCNFEMPHEHRDCMAVLFLQKVHYLLKKYRKCRRNFFNRNIAMTCP